MDSEKDLDIPDINNAMPDKTKESILRMKKKMFCTHELIVQYNNKLEECDRLKRELFITKNETMNWKQENGQNYTKFVELKAQIDNYKKNQTLLEEKIATQDILMAGDKSLVDQLKYKLENVEKECSNKIMETDLKKSSMEVKNKQLEQEIKKLRKSAQDAKSHAKLPENKKVKSSTLGTQTEFIRLEKVDIGINTVEIVPVAVKKVDKAVLTDFHNIKDKLYPMLCDKCDSMSKGNIENFCKAMTNHPPLLERILSPPLPQELYRPDRLPEPQFDKRKTKNDASQLEAVASELENLNQKLSTLLECRKKKRKKKSSRKKEYASPRCCHGRHHDVVPSSQADFVAEIVNRVMNFKHESLRGKVSKNSKINRKKRSRVAKRKMKVVKKKKKNNFVGSTNWEVESNDPPESNSEISHNESHSQVSHILRLKPSDYNEVDEQELSCDERPTDNKTTKNVRNRKMKLFNDDDESSKKNNKKQMSKPSKTRSSVRIHERSLRDQKVDQRPSSCEKESFSIFSEQNLEEAMDVSLDSSLIINPEDSQSQMNIDETSQNDSNLNSQEFDERSNISDDIGTDEENSSQMSPRRNSRKRKRSRSPAKTAKATGRSKLMGKLRALKKNSKLITVRRNNYSSVNDQTQPETTKESSVETKSSPVRVAVIKQRIAHVPKKLSTDETLEESRIWQNVAKQTFKHVNKRFKGNTENDSNPEPEKSQTSNLGSKNLENNQIEVQRMKPSELMTENSLEISYDTSKLIDSIPEMNLHKNVETENEKIERQAMNSTSKNEEIQEDVSKLSKMCDISKDEKTRSANSESTLIDESPISPGNDENSNFSTLCSNLEEMIEKPTSVYENVILSESLTAQSDGENSNVEETNKSEINTHQISRVLSTRQSRKSCNDDSSEKIDPARYQRRIRSLNTLLGQHLVSVQKNTGKRYTQLRRNAAIDLQTESEKLAKEEILELVENEEWTNEVQENVISKLCQVSKERTIAKCIVDVLVEKSDPDEPFDRTHTPPAPVMTRTQQRIIALISRLEREPSMSGVFELVRAGIEINLFKLGQPIETVVVDCFSRMLVVMARMKKDRERVRILCCDALYFLGRKACRVIHIIMSIWPEVFPMYGSQTDDLVTSLVHLVRKDQNEKSIGVKRLLKDFHNYPESDAQSIALVQTILKKLNDEYTGELEMSVLLLAKREGTAWTYKHIVNGGLLKIIEDDDHPFLLNAFILLGFIMRTFPAEDSDKTISSIVEKLCKMFESSEGLPDKQEGIVSALLSLARFTLHFERVADTILKWKPKQLMRVGTIQQLNSFFKLRSPDWWTKRKQHKTQ